MRTIKPYHRKGTNDGWRFIISLSCGLAAAYGIFRLDGVIINSLISGFENADLKMIAKIILWIITFGLTVWVSILVGVLVGKFVDILLGGKV